MKIDNIRAAFDNIFIQNKNNNYEILDSDLCEFTKEYIISNKNNIPMLYRFVPADYQSIRNLETNSLFLSQIGMMNDVFEGVPSSNENMFDSLNQNKNRAYVKAFSEKNDSLLMWAHYANNFTGFCIQYDLSEMDDKYLYHLFPVHYSNTRIIDEYTKWYLYELEDLKKCNNDLCASNETDFIKDKMALFLQKAKEWEYEKEWRIIATYDQIYNTADNVGNENIELYGIEDIRLSVDKCVKAIYLGPRMESEIKKHIKEICDRKGCTTMIYDTSLSNKKYELVFNRY